MTRGGRSPGNPRPDHSRVRVLKNKQVLFPEYSQSVAAGSARSIRNIRKGTLQECRYPRQVALQSPKVSKVNVFNPKNKLTRNMKIIKCTFNHKNKLTRNMKIIENCHLRIRNTRRCIISSSSVWWITSSSNSNIQLLLLPTSCELSETSRRRFK